ncbi:MAG TPA: D-alanyl-D-alanine carboxypeptidase [Gammaproteobacteria bacterium]|nr:D-alanyl-D-alanine carboxypeptidase [Gammaproteobacteria bacterium]
MISVVTGTNSDKDRTNQSKALLNYGFRFFETRRLYEAAKPVATARVWKGESPEVKLGIAKDLYVTYPRGQDKLLSATMDRPERLEAPLSAGQVVGKVKVTVNGVGLDEVPLVALNKVPQGGFFRRMYDSVMLMLE